MIRSMTGFATAKGAMGPHEWAWDLRAVNGRGADLRLRVPDWIAGLEQALRPPLARAVARGNVTLSLRVTRHDGPAGLPGLNDAALGAALAAIAEVEARALRQGIALAPSAAVDVIALRGVMDMPQPAGDTDADTAALMKALVADLEPLLAAFQRMRAEEGAALAAVLAAQLEQISGLTDEAAALAEARKDDMAAQLRANLARVLDNAEGADPQRIAQELAMIAVKTDVTEEIDRLRAHVGAARDLLAAGGTVGRKLDFLMQEFNREANTLCSKSQSPALTTVGLALKAVIDQMREQVQNVE
ncbi:MAG: YicC family protein [Rhodobacteraceae bacterium]|nr:YicC family protein [Paracoccaceae bacterium]